MTEGIYKRTAGFISNCVGTALSLVKVLWKSKFSVRVPEIAHSKCLVLGTGPSLKVSLQSHMDYIQQHDHIAVNAFAATDEYLQLQPKHYIILDPAFWLTKHPTIMKTWDPMIARTSWKMNLFIPYESRNAPILKELTENKFIEVHYYNYTVYKGFDGVGHALYKKGLAMPQCQNVLVAATFMAVQLGYKEIELLGADHNWHEQLHVTEDNVVSVRQVHFNENVEKMTYVPFYKLTHSKEVFRMDEIFTAWAKVFAGYINVQRYAQSRGVHISNASEFSFIDAFKRIKI
jgi:hypothetical protein